jgi:putative pyruvate formate lyase activating enzyme
MDYFELYKKCELCPHKCKVNRFRELGYCMSSNEVKISTVSYYKGEEPCFYIDKGVGAIFFSNCTMRCVYCQNYAFSQLGNGEYIDSQKLVDIILEINDRASYLELITPTHFIPSILNALEIAKSKGFNLPIIYNTSGYEDVQSLKLLKGIIDIYLVDFRYSNNESSRLYSKVNNYFDVVKKTITEMYNQTGNLILDDEKRAIRGILVRYLVLPNFINDHKIIFDWLYDNFGKYLTLSIMDQYVPVYKAREIKELNSYVSKDRYTDVVDYAVNKGFENLYIQTRLLD